MKLYASGDSITLAIYLPANQKYANLNATKLGATLTSFAVGGDMAADQSIRSQAVFLASGDMATILVGTNDHRTYDLSVPKKEHYRAFLVRLVGNYVQPSRVSARAATKSGTWANSDTQTGIHTEVAGSSVTASVNGRFVSVGYIIHDYAPCVGSVAQVYVDGSLAASYTCDGYTDHMQTANGGKWGCAQINIDTGEDGPHTVQVVNESPGKRIYVDDIRGSAQSAKPRVVLGTIPPMSQQAYDSSGSSIANLAAYNQIVGEVADEFAGMGFDVRLADVSGVLDIATDFVDNVHTNAVGQLKTSQEFLTQLRDPYSRDFPTATGGVLRLDLNTRDQVVGFYLMDG